MVQSYKMYVDGYVEKGLLNKEALVVNGYNIIHRPMSPHEEFVIDACVYANSSVGLLIRVGRGMPDKSHPSWDRTVHDAVQSAVHLWESHGYLWSEKNITDCEIAVSGYLYGCFTARLRGIFRNNTAERLSLYAAMARVGMSRTDARESLDKVLTCLWPEHRDGEYTDEVLDALVKESINTGAIRVD